MNPHRLFDCTPLEQAAAERFAADGDRETFCAHLRVAAEWRGLEMARRANQRLLDRYTFS